MKKTISQAQLNARKSRGGKVLNQPTSPKPIIDKPVGDDETVNLANKVIESAARVESAVAASVELSNENMRQMQDALQQALLINSQTENPIPYDLVIQRRKDGLMDRIRLQPVIDGKVH